MQHTTTQHESTSCFGSRRLSTVHTVDTPHSNPPPLEIRVFKVDCTTEVPISNHLHATLYPRIDRRGANGVSKDHMKRRRKNHHVLPIYRQCERLVGGLNQLLQGVFQIENPLFIVISLADTKHPLCARSNSLRSPSPCSQIISALLPRNLPASRDVNVSY